MPSEWLHVANTPKNEAGIEALGSKLDQDEMPYVVILKPDGNQVLSNGREIIQLDPASAYSVF